MDKKRLKKRLIIAAIVVSFLILITVLLVMAGLLVFLFMQKDPAMAGENADWEILNTLIKAIAFLLSPVLIVFAAASVAAIIAGIAFLFSDLKTDYNFKVIGAFYTNTKASDDNGYVFPYNVTEQMEPSSALEFYTMLHYRFLYDTGASPIRSDKLITISCPTSYHKDFRFVVVGVARDDDKKFTVIPFFCIRDRYNIL